MASLISTLKSIFRRNKEGWSTTYWERGEDGKLHEISAMDYRDRPKARG